jgi:hypothetical protein
MVEYPIINPGDNQTVMPAVIQVFRNIVRSLSNIPHEYAFHHLKAHLLHRIECLSLFELLQLQVYFMFTYSFMII